MKHNIYPVTIRKFLKASSVGSSHILFYCILKDRLHFELPIENATFISQKFIKSIKDEMPENSLHEPIMLYLKSNFGERTWYRYYPSEEEKFKLLNTKLYSRLVTTFVAEDANPEEETYEVEEDKIITVYQGEKRVMEFEKR